MYRYERSTVFIYTYICMNICTDIHKRSTVWLKKVSTFLAFFSLFSIFRFFFITLFCRFYRLTCRNPPALEKIPTQSFSKPGKFSNILHHGMFSIWLWGEEQGGTGTTHTWHNCRLWYDLLQTSLIEMNQRACVKPARERKKKVSG